MNTDVLAHFNISSDAPARRATVVDWISDGLLGSNALPALSFGDAEMSRRALDELSGQVAAHLRENGTRRGDRVGLCMNRSFEMIACLIGVLKAGAAYVPLDPAYPKERLRAMREDARLAALLVHREWAGLFPETPLLIWEESESSIRSARPWSESDLEPEDTVYVMFTSGSTGRPKGVEMPHRALSNLIEWQVERESFAPAARVLQFSSMSFDVSFQEIATTLASGGTLYLIDDAARRDPRELLSVLLDNGIERIFLPYVAFRGLVETVELQGARPPLLKEVITAGERLRVDAAARAFFAAVDGASLDNQYGPSETHVITANLLKGDPAAWPDLPDIGLPIKNCGTCVLNERGDPVAVGEIGELHLTGRNLAKGYINQAEGGKNPFIANPFDAPERPMLYKSGDLASYTPEGRLAFHGRMDDQVKIRGHRVEPSEINAVVGAFPGVAQCAARAITGEDRLVQLAVYFSSASGETLDTSAMRASLADRLPEYMVPAFLIQLGAFPVTPSGKVDLNAMPKPTIDDTRFAHHETKYDSDTQRALAEIWEQLLGLSAIPPAADFFELGGDSLRAVSLFLEIEKVFGEQLPLATLAAKSTLRELAEVIEGHRAGPDLSSYRSLKMLRPGKPSVTPLYLIHGGHGNVLVFSELSRALGPDRPVYAFQWPGWDGRAASASIEELVKAYHDELLRFQKSGPIRLGGYCIGGLIAIELAPMLRASGIEVIDPLVLCDSPNLASATYRTSEPWDSAVAIAEFDRMLDRLDGLRVAEVVNDQEEKRKQYVPPSGWAAWVRSIPGVMPILRAAKSWRDDRADRVIWKKTRDWARSGREIPMEFRADYARISLVRAAKRYRGAPYMGAVLYLRSNSAIGREFALKGWWSDPSLGFEELCAGRFEAWAVGGVHADVVKQPGLWRLVRDTLDDRDPN